MSDLHAQLKSFLQQFPAQPGDEAITKAGLLPFVGGKIFVMKPRAERPDLPPPPWQICKGTVEKGEALVETSLREGMEELGLKISMIDALRDAGIVTFASASTGASKRMRLFLARMKSEDGFGEKVDDTTAARTWMSVEEFKKNGREDHVRIAVKALALV